ncbi:unnamed protein product [Symbiodinium necroappetens]|uniref:Non-specific serine/threonine protein kinase n=1 Tax=Symbiodinium necroappetens TaxID=1628268 RepID=A0A812P9F8_9DINO|nr:unnamed protein product [Symbiodinium necroappetens]
MSAFRPGDMLRLIGLTKKPQLNQSVVRYISCVDDRCIVLLANGTHVRVRPENLVLEQPGDGQQVGRPLLQMPRFGHPWQGSAPEQREKRREEMAEDFVHEMGEPLSPARERLFARWQPGQSQRYHDAYEAWLKSGEFEVEFKRDGNVYYHPELVIGRGAHATVFLGIVPSDGREVAVKVHSDSQGNGGDHFVKEVQAMKKNAAVPGVIQYITSFEKERIFEEQGRRKRRREERLQVVILELMEGTLQQAMSRWGDLVAGEHIDTICYVSRSLLDIVKQLNPNIIHRDIKPDNIMIDCRGNIKLSDFGISRMLTAGQDRLYTSAEGSSLPFTPPEALRSKLHKTSDLYSVGRVMLAMMLSDATMRRMGDSSLEVLVLVSWPAHSRYAFIQLVRALTHQDEEDRAYLDRLKDPTFLYEVIQSHPFFWSQRRNLSFLTSLGNYYSNCQSRPPEWDRVVWALEKAIANACEKQGMNRDGWKAIACDLEQDESRRRKIEGAKWNAELLRFFRNKVLHEPELGPGLLQRLPAISVFCWEALLCELTTKGFPFHEFFGVSEACEL